ncbi:ABC transporter ATP-binding protein [Streptomyces sp. NRRL S-118]|uniref:ABC transporter ATP-binding protein n=1 Tax=Streptomyces sp. NRRL S-118 TaxID=1463881 RepID=UPI000694B1CF|nr:ABC transporter ATP-binding protein [Streptomyces sp. NRRL S-118]
MRRRGPAARVLPQARRFLRRRKRALLVLTGWSLLESAHTFLTGYGVARALDDGFLAGRTGTGLLWLATAAVAALVGGAAVRGVFTGLAGLVEPLRDGLVRRAVSQALAEAVADPAGADGGAGHSATVSRLVHQTEMARDSFAGLVLTARSFVFTALGALLGMASLAPVLLLVVVPPLVLGLALFVATLAPMAAAQRAFLDADEDLSARVGAIGAGLRDVAACGGERWIAEDVGRVVDTAERLSRRLARWAGIRTLALGAAGRLPVVALVVATPWLLRRGITAGALLGALTYLVQALLPALHTLMAALGAAGTRLLVVLDRFGTEEPRLPGDAPAGEERAAEPEDGTAPSAGPGAAPAASGAAGSAVPPSGGSVASMAGSLPRTEPAAGEGTGARSPAASSAAGSAVPARPGPGAPVADSLTVAPVGGAAGTEPAARPGSPAAGSGTAAAGDGRAAAGRSRTADEDKGGAAGRSGAAPPAPYAPPRATAPPRRRHGTRRAQPAAVAVELRGVGFAYGPRARPVLDDLDLVVEPGEHLAVVGPSGIGKSTLAALLAGLLAPGRGTVLIDGAPARRPGPPGPDPRRALLPQQAYVFTGTVRDNLRYLRPDAAPDEVQETVEALRLGPLVRRLGGPDAVIDPGRLSQGERQRLALARAHLAAAPLLVLDEATCHLDAETEEHAERTLAACPGTLIVIAHRLSSAVRADRVLILDGTHAVCAPHRELLGASPLYRDLVGVAAG